MIKLTKKTIELLDTVTSETCRPSSSVSKARFVTAGAISMKLGVRIPWALSPEYFLIFAILPILWPTGGHLENQTFYGRLHHILPGFWI
jgi:hypothetical protein